MKHLLPILTVALALTTTTASAAYYYDYYLDPPNTEPADNPYYGNRQQSDSFTYGTRDNNGEAIENPNVFTVARETKWDTKFAWPNSVKDNFFRIDVPDTNAGKVTLYLTDFVSEVVPQVDYPYNSSTNALFNMDIVEYGYRELTLINGKYVPGETVTKSILVADDKGEIVVNDKNYSLSGSVTPIDSIDYNGTGNAEDVMIRYKYELGTFDPDTTIELYMKDSSGREIYSFSSYGGVDEKTGENVYTPFDNSDITLNQTTGANGFGDGGYRVPQGVTDEMLFSYYFVEEIKDGEGNLIRENADYHDYTKFDSDKTLASKKAMPLSHLTPFEFINNAISEGTTVQFGIYGVTAAGSPLPGGLQVTLIAGLFGLGFWYVRRRKITVA